MTTLQLVNFFLLEGKRLNPPLTLEEATDCAMRFREAQSLTPKPEDTIKYAIKGVKNFEERQQK